MCLYSSTVTFHNLCIRTLSSSSLSSSSSSSLPSSYHLNRHRRRRRRSQSGRRPGYRSATVVLSSTYWHRCSSSSLRRSIRLLSRRCRCRCCHHFHQRHSYRHHHHCHRRRRCRRSAYSGRRPGYRSATVVFSIIIVRPKIGRGAADRNETCTTRSEIVSAVRKLHSQPLKSFSAVPLALLSRLLRIYPGWRVGDVNTLPH